MKKNDAFPSEYLKVSDVSGAGEVYVIANVQMEEFDDRDSFPAEKVKKPTVTFSNSSKRLILNQTNWDRIEKQHGPDTDGWRGKSITLCLESVTAFGKTADAIRVKVA